MAQRQCDLEKYINKVLNEKEGVVTEEDQNSKKCRICGIIVSKGNFSRHASYHRKCKFCDDFHYLKDLKDGKCPVYNELLFRFFPSAAELKINIYDRNLL
jgi:CRISPR/Cas system-associated protein Cas10 (large subunit of type III CRISPR-Cas system)